MLNDLNKARAILRKGGTLVELAEAIGAIVNDPASTVEDIKLGLRHRGFVAEQAVVALHRRLGTQPRPVASHSSESAGMSVLPQWQCFTSADPDAEWYPTIAFHMFLGIRAIVAGIIASMLSGATFLSLGWWITGTLLLAFAVMVSVILSVLRLYRLRTTRCEEALHEITHRVRDHVNRIVSCDDTRLKAELISHFHSDVAECIAELFRRRAGDDSSNCIIRVVRDVGGSEAFVTVGRSRGLMRERERTEQPLRPNEGIARAILARNSEGAFIIRDLSSAVEAGIWKPTPNDQLKDARTYLVCPINGWHLGEKTTLGILSITSKKDRFQPVDWVPLKAVSDLLGLVYPLVYCAHAQDEQSRFAKTTIQVAEQPNEPRYAVGGRETETTTAKRVGRKSQNYYIAPKGFRSNPDETFSDN